MIDNMPGVTMRPWLLAGTRPPASTATSVQGTSLPIAAEYAPFVGTRAWSPPV